jgi:hypothetical protein
MGANSNSSVGGDYPGYCSVSSVALTPEISTEPPNKDLLHLSERISVATRMIRVASISLVPIWTVSTSAAWVDGLADATVFGWTVPMSVLGNNILIDYRRT